MTRTWVVTAGAILVLGTPRPVMAQTLSQQLARAPDGAVRLSFAARAGVCGNSRGMIFEGRHTVFISSRSWNISDRDSTMSGCPCDQGPVRVSLEIRDHRVNRMRTSVGGHWGSSQGPTTDLGVVGAAAAVDFLLGIARSEEDQASEAIFTATLADSTTLWPRLLAMAKDPAVPLEARRQAVFWVSEAAGEAATRGLDSLAGDRGSDEEIRKQAIFALSQRPTDESVPVLIRIAKTNPDPELRRTALFWLGQSEDPRVLALFEELLTRR